MSFRAATRGSHRVSVSFNGQDIKGPPFELRVHCVSAEQSILEVKLNTAGIFPTINERMDAKIVAVDQDGTLLKQGGDQFKASITVDDQPQVSVVFFHNYFLEITCILTGCTHHHRPEQWDLHSVIHSHSEWQVCSDS